MGFLIGQTFSLFPKPDIEEEVRHELLFFEQCTTDTQRETFYELRDELETLLREERKRYYQIEALRRGWKVLGYKIYILRRAIFDPALDE